VILVDTGVWSQHFHRRNAVLIRRLADREVVVHPWIVGELALGPGMRGDVLRDVGLLPSLSVVADLDLLAFIQLHSIRGIGWVDVQLLVSTLAATAKLWTTDRHLARIAERFGVALS
jgi:hypothetical protein